jgi:hypothetical protein
LKKSSIWLYPATVTAPPQSYHRIPTLSACFQSSISTHFDILIKNDFLFFQMTLLRTGHTQPQISSTQRILQSSVHHSLPKKPIQHALAANLLLANPTFYY